MIIACIDSFDVIKVGRDSLWTFVNKIIRVDNIISDQVSSFHHPWFGSEHDVLTQFDDKGEIIFPAPAFRQLTTHGICGQIGIGNKWILASLPNAFFKVSRNQLFSNDTCVVIALPGPVCGVP